MPTTDYFGITEAADSSAADYAASTNAILVALDEALGIRREDLVPINSDGTSAPGTIEVVTGTRARTLPSAPPEQTHVVYIALNADVTVSRGGSDTITRFGTSGATSAVVARNTIGVFRYRSGVWYRIDPQQVAGGDVSGTIDALTVGTWGGQTKGQVVGGNAPQAHKASHGVGGPDPLTAADVAALAKASNLSDVASAAAARTNLGLPDGAGVAPFLQLLSAQKLRLVFGSGTVTWAAEGDATNGPDISHGLGATPIFVALAWDGTGSIFSVPHLSPRARTNLTFQTWARTPGVSQAAGATAGFLWVALG